jgi:hypothetical protein
MVVCVEGLGTPTRSTNPLVEARRRYVPELRAITRGNAATDSRRLLRHPFRPHWKTLSDLPVNKGGKFEDFVTFDG